MGQRGNARAGGLVALSLLTVIRTYMEAPSRRVEIDTQPGSVSNAS